MKSVYVRNNNSIFKISMLYIISLTLLLIFGIYKNGVYLYIKNYVTLLGMFKPLIFILTGGLIGSLVNIIYEKLIKKSKENFKDILFSSFHIVYGLLIASLLSINTNYFLFISITFIFLLLSKIFTIKSVNVVALCSLIIILLTYFFSDFTYLNAYETNTILNLNTTDYLLGRGSGGIATTCISLLILSFIILWNTTPFKKEISIYSIITFTILIIIYSIYKSNIASIFDIIFTNGILFSYVFVAPEPISSSYTKIGKIIYGIITGLLTFIFYLINPSLAVLGAILIASILSSVIDVKFE